MSASKMSGSLPFVERVACAVISPLFAYGCLVAPG
jgi:hypothetical protein